MSSENAALEKSYAFALRTVKLCKVLASERKEYVLSKQLLRSGTSVGANIEEANGAQSERDFLSKMSIAYKEARESHYWLRLLRDSDTLTPKEASSILTDCDELLKLLKLLGTILKTLRKKQP